jgi:putative hydrolases of HD superfamily
MSTSSRLDRQLWFLREADKLKTIARRTPLCDGSRMENSAEHSWHLALAAMLLHEYAPPDLNLLRVLELVTVHDLVEIDAGDTFAYDAAGHETKAAREQAAADRLFGLLPAEDGRRMRQLWEEFEAQQTPESEFANALDRLQPLLLNSSSGGGSWRGQNLTRRQVLQRMAPVERGIPAAWPFVLAVIESYCEAGVILRSEATPV